MIEEIEYLTERESLQGLGPILLDLTHRVKCIGDPTEMFKHWSEARDALGSAACAMTEASVQASPSMRDTGGQTEERVTDVNADFASGLARCSSKNRWTELIDSDEDERRPTSACVKAASCNPRLQLVTSGPSPISCHSTTI